MNEFILSDWQLYFIVSCHVAGSFSLRWMYLAHSSSFYHSLQQELHQRQYQRQQIVASYTT